MLLGTIWPVPTAAQQEKPANHSTVTGISTYVFSFQWFQSQVAHSTVA